MQIITEAKQRVAELLQDNTTTLLTAGGVVGTVATGVLAWRGGYKTALKSDAVLREDAKAEGVDADLDDVKLTKTTQAQIAAPYIIPPIIVGTATITAIIMGHRMNAQKAAALAAAYGLTQKHFEEYKAKVAEKLTPNKEQKVVDELAQDRVNNTPGHTTVIIGDGEVLCFDEASGRYFRGTMDAIRKAENSTNAEIIHHDHASASYFYEELGIPATQWSDEVGWNTDQLLELKITSTLTDDDKPCISIDFKNYPKADYVPRHF